jgi:hypothetical protein
MMHMDRLPLIAGLNYTKKFFNAVSLCLCTFTKLLQLIPHFSLQQHPQHTTTYQQGETAVCGK